MQIFIKTLATAAVPSTTAVLTFHSSKENHEIRSITEFVNYVAENIGIHPALFNLRLLSGRRVMSGTTLNRDQTLSMAHKSAAEYKKLLIIAAETNDSGTFGALMRLGAGKLFPKRKSDGASALHIVAASTASGAGGMARMMLGPGGLDEARKALETKDLLGRTPLQIACIAVSSLARPRADSLATLRQLLHSLYRYNFRGGGSSPIRRTQDALLLPPDLQWWSVAPSWFAGRRLIAPHPHLAIRRALNAQWYCPADDTADAALRAKQRWLCAWSAARRVEHTPLALVAARVAPLEAFGTLLHKRGSSGLPNISLRFLGEPAAGDGLRREWLSLAMSELCDVRRGLFILREVQVHGSFVERRTQLPNPDGLGGSYVQTQTVWVHDAVTVEHRLEPNPDSALALALDGGDEHFFFIFGALVVIALSRGETVGGGSIARWTESFSALFLGVFTPSHATLRSLDADLDRNLRLVTKYSEEELESLDITMVAVNSSRARGFGGEAAKRQRMEERPLFAGSKDVAVTTANRARYVELVMERVCDDYQQSIASQIAAIRRGAACAATSPDVFEALCALVDTPLHLNALLLGANAPIDVDAWESSSLYSPSPDFHKRHIVARWFWEIVRCELSVTQRATLLEFTTGSSALPPTGFGSLPGYDGSISVFTLQMLSNVSALNRTVTAATCFNTIRLRPYPTKNALREQLLLAMASFRGGGFSEVVLGILDDEEEQEEEEEEDILAFHDLPEVQVLAARPPEDSSIATAI